MRVKFDFNVDAWIQDVEVEGDSLEDAKAKLYDMSLEVLLIEGYLKHFVIKDIDSEVISENLKVKVTDIDYNIDEDDIPKNMTKEDIVETLPKELELEVELDSDSDIEDAIADEITLKTDWLVNTFKYEILERK